MSPDGTLDSRQRYDALALSLSARKSTPHFAHAGVAAVVMLILAGTAGRLFYKGSAQSQTIATAVAAIALCCLLYAGLRLLIGRARLKVELAQFAQLQALRKELGLDDPKRQMP